MVTGKPPINSSLSQRDALPHRPRRVLVAGASGSGKTTVAAAVADVLAIAHIEIDALHHGPQWTVRPTFERDVHEFSAAHEWVTEWQYPQVRKLLADRADLVVWLDLSRAVVIWQVVRRTLSRRIHRTRLWNGNLEPPLRTFFTDPEHIVRWSWATYAQTPARIRILQERRPDLPVVSLTSRRAVRAWLAGPLSTAAGRGRRGQHKGSDGSRS